MTIHPIVLARIDRIGMRSLMIISILGLIDNVNALVSIGANLDGLRDWSRSLPWVNLIRQACVRE